MIDSRLTPVRTSRGLVWPAILSAVISLSTAAAAEPHRSSQKSVSDIFTGGSPDSVADLKAMQTHQQQVARTVAAATVAVRVGPAQGSGVIVSKDGYVLTAAHVAGKAGRRVFVNLSDGRVAFGKTLGLYRDLDAGLIKLDEMITNGRVVEWPFVELGDSDQLAPGQWVMGLGHPGGFEADRPVVVRLGRVLENHANYVKTDCKLVGGDSGGPLFDMDGKVVAVHSRIGTSLTNNMHAPVSAFRDSWTRLATSEVWGRLPGPRPYIGIFGETTPDRCVVRQVRSGGAAAKAGIRQGDTVIRFAGRRVTDFDSLKSMVDECSPDQEIAVTIQRESSTLELTLIVGTSKE